MKKIIYLLLFQFMLHPLYECNAQETDTDAKYSFKKGDPNGIGKWYMGREIAHVMGFQGIGWLNRPEREAEENTAKLLLNMAISDGDVIADIGAGSGYHVFKMAPLVGKGFIFAVDIQDEMLVAIKEGMESRGISNVKPIKGSEKSVNLPENSVDKILMVDVYHEFNFPMEMLASIRKALRVGGKIYLIEYRGEDESVPIKKVHKMTETQAIIEMGAVGMKLQENIGNLPWQHCLVFVEK